MKPRSATWRLALSYLAIIMTLSGLFSVAVFVIISLQLDRPLPPPTNPQAAQQMASAPPQAGDFSLDQQARVRQRDDEARGSVLWSLVAVNVVMLAGGTVVSCHMARRTLQPIEAAMMKQAQFVSDASHELRTPLTALLLKNEVALRKKQLDDAKARDVLSQNILEIEKLRSLSNSLLDLAKSENPSGEPELVSLKELVGGVLEPFRQMADQKQIDLQEYGHEVGGATMYVTAVQQILAILLDNAIKYTPQSGSVTVSVQKTSKFVQFTVKDTGIGIQPADQARIFERFYRADAARTRTDTSGHGLGLAIAKAVADRHGYGLEVRSLPVVAGVEFTLRIPR